MFQWPDLRSTTVTNVRMRTVGQPRQQTRLHGERERGEGRMCLSDLQRREVPEVFVFVSAVILRFILATCSGSIRSA